MEQAEEQKVIEAKIRMRQQELLDDEEREQRREENIRAGRIRLQTPRSQPVTNNEIASAPTDEINFLDWGYGDRQPQVLETLDSRESNAPRLNPYLWVEGDYRRSGGFDAAAPSQQSAEPNTVPALSQQQPEIGVPTLQAPSGAIRARHRDDDFDLDLEDIMVMEAIWLSIQEQGARHRFSDGEATRSVPNRPAGLALENSFSSELDGTNTRAPPPPAVPEPESWHQHSGRQGTAAVGLAGAIAALAEQQAVSPNTTHAIHPTVTSSLQPSLSDDHSVPEVSNINEEPLVSTGDAPASQAHESSQRSEELPQSGRENGVREMPVVVSTSGRGKSDAENSSRAFEKLANWVSSTQKEYKGSSVNTWLGDQSSERVEVGTSFSSSVPSASDLPWEAPDIPSDSRNGESSGGFNNDKVLVPDSFEEQMMLAMALSLADAQARVRHGGNHSGPLPQATHFTDAQARVRQGISRSGPLPRPTYIGQ